MDSESVLFVTTSFPRFHNDFAGSFVFRFAKYLARDGLKITVIAPGTAHVSSQQIMDGVEILRFSYFLPSKLQVLAYGNGIPANLRNSWLARFQIPCFGLAAIGAVLREQDRHDIIHCHWLPMALAALFARPFSRTKPPIILTNWGSDTRLLPRRLSHWTVHHVDGCISTAIETDQHLQALGRFDFRRIMAPVDEERFALNKVEPDIRQELDLDPVTPVLAFIGRLDSFKDPLTFIRACALLKDEETEFVALIAGDGELMSACQEQVTKSRLKDEVLLLGQRSDPERVLRVACAAVHVSPIENTWANVIAEAMFMNVPVVISSAGYTEKLFTHEKDCLIVPPSDPLALAVALKRLVDNAELRTTLVNGGRKLLFECKKDSRSIVRETRAFYDELLAKRMREI